MRADALRMRAHTTWAERDIDLLASGDVEPSFVWMRAGEGVVAYGEAARIPIPRAGNRFEEAAAGVADLFAGISLEGDAAGSGTGPIAFGSFSFDPKSASESVLIIPSVVLARRGGRLSKTTITPLAGAAGRAVSRAAKPGGGKVRYAGSSVPEVRWLESVDAAVHAIQHGEVDKVVLARDLLVWSEDGFDLSHLVRRLAARFPKCFTFACDSLVGATPELLVRRSGDSVESVVLAGSIKRGANEAHDRQLQRELLSSPKDRAEHALSVTSVADVLQRVCSSVAAAAGPSLMQLENVQHLSTTVRGSLARPLTALQLAGTLHPTAAVCGAPREQALAMIRTLEGLDRDRYAGPVGWVDHKGDGEWGIALRCGLFNGTRGRLFAGAGIVAGARPEAELEETRLKLRAMMSALSDD